MVLVDTSVWRAFLRRDGRAASFGRLLATDELSTILVHPIVIGELTLGGISLGTRRLLEDFERATVASLDEVQALIDGHPLAHRGVGYADAALLASARLTRADLWTFDRKKQAIAAELNLAYSPAASA